MASLKKKWRRSGAFIANFEHISHLSLVFLLLILNMQLPVGMSNSTKKSDLRPDIFDKCNCTDLNFEY